MTKDKNKSTKNGKIVIIIISILLALTILGVVLGAALFKFTESLFGGNKEEKDVISAGELNSVENILYQDFKNGELSADEYVKYSMYSVYNNEMLPEKYADINIGINTTDPDKLVEKYQDELSEETLGYYFDKCMMTDVTFLLDEENEEADKSNSFNDLFVMKAYAFEGAMVNLDQIAVSPDENVFVWYTTDGVNACTEDTAQNIADTMEHTIYQYEELFECDYTFEAVVYSKGENYKNQVEILEKYGYSGERLEDTLQVYIFNFGASSALAQHQAVPPTLLELYYKMRSMDEVGAVANPHIRINAKAMEDPEKLEQLYNHELFHEFQGGTLTYGGERELNGEDERIIEATANLASAYATNKTTIKGYLNIWASNAMRTAGNLLSDKTMEMYGYETVGYMLFVYMYNYAQNVPDGLLRISDSMYEDDPLWYLGSVDKEYLIATQRETGLKYLTHNYENKNLIPDPDHNDGINTPRFLIDVNLSDRNSVVKTDKELAKIGIEYYKFDSDFEEYGCEIEFTRERFGTSAYLIGLVDGYYMVLDSFEGEEGNEYTFEPNLYPDVKNFYFMVTNCSLISDTVYSVKFNKTEALDMSEPVGPKPPEEYDKPWEEVDDAGSVGHMSFVNNYPAEPELCEKFITTFYYNAEGNVCRIVLTYYLVNEDIAQEWYEFESENNWLHIHLEENVLTVEYPYDIVAEYSGDTTVEELYEWKEEPSDVIWYMYGDYIDFTPVF